jgi:hypothetical membrane protein
MSLRRPSPRQLAGLALLVGAVGFLLLERLAEASYPSFDPTVQPLSGLGNLAAPTRSLWVAALVLLAISWLVAAAIVVRPGASRLLLTLNVVPVAGILLAAAVPLDANLAVHELAAFVALVTGNLAMLLNAERLPKPWRLPAVGLSVAALAGLSPAAAFLVGRVGWGTLERIVVAPLIASLVTFGLALVASRTAPAVPLPGAPHGRRRVVLAVAVALAITGVGTGLTAGGTTVVAAELSRVVGGLIPG